ncbi:MAG TPA: hypothetical protein DEQ83_06125 [Rhodobiaceae bacterium]|nr:hypothetical protein [Rhodobiaceae bacterium]
MSDVGFASKCVKRRKGKIEKNSRIKQAKSWKLIQKVVRGIKNWWAKAHQFQISMSERTNHIGEVGLLRRGRRTENFVAHFYQCYKNLPYTRRGRNRDILL